MKKPLLSIIFFVMISGYFTMISHCFTMINLAIYHDTLLFYHDIMAKVTNLCSHENQPKPGNALTIWSSTWACRPRPAISINLSTHCGTWKCTYALELGWGLQSRAHSHWIWKLTTTPKT